MNGFWTDFCGSRNVPSFLDYSIKGYWLMLGVVGGAIIAFGVLPFRFMLRDLITHIGMGRGDDHGNDKVR